MRSKSHTTILLAAFVLLAAYAVTGDNTSNGGNLIAILASGDITDFGYSNTVNAGRIYMERTLNISGSLFSSNIETRDEALAVMTELVQQGYKLIISTTTAHGNAASVAAAMYPDVNFAMSGSAAKLPNLGTIGWSGADQYYIAGMFCGAMSQTNRVGFVHAGPPLSSVGTLNAFTVGAKTANPNVEVFSVYTDSYLNPDRTTGACKMMLAHGIDMLAGHQDDLTLQNIAMNSGFLAVGTSGYSLRDIYGETVGMSVIRNWGIPFRQFAMNALNGVPYNASYSGSFKNNATTLDTPSHLVPDAVWATVQGGVNALKTLSVKPYYCTPVVAEMGLSETTGCLTNTSKFSAARLSEINHLGTYHVPLDDVPFPKGASIAIIVIASVLYLITCGIAIALYFLHRDTVMLAASPVFLGIVLFGIAIVFSAAIVWVSEPSANICAARIWLPSVGVTLSMGAMIIKNVRLMIIFDAQLRRVRIRDIKLLIWISILLAADALLLGLWTGLGDPEVHLEQAKDGLSTYQVRKVCATNDTGDHILYAIIAWHAAQLLVGCFVTFKIRVIDIEEFNESRPFGLSIYIVALVYTIAGILIGTSGTTNVQLVIITSLSLLIGSVAVLFLLFAPKFLTIFTKGSRPLERFLSSAMAQKKPDSSGGSKERGSSTTASATETNSTPMKEVPRKTVDVVEV